MLGPSSHYVREAIAKGRQLEADLAQARAETAALVEAIQRGSFESGGWERVIAVVDSLPAPARLLLSEREADKWTIASLRESFTNFLRLKVSDKPFEYEGYSREEMECISILAALNVRDAALDGSEAKRRAGVGKI